MRLSPEHIRSLQALLKGQYGLDYTDEQAQEAGAAIIRFLAAKSHRQAELIKKGVPRGNQKQSE